MRQIASRRRWIGGAAGGLALLTIGVTRARATDCPTVACAEADPRSRRDREEPRRTSPEATRTPPDPRRTPPEARRNPPEARRVPPRVSYTLWNASDQHIRFRLPSGKAYVLAPGRRARHRNTFRGEPLTIHVFNTGRTYRLRNGNHKFFWHRRENRVGLDLNYDTD